MIDGVVVVDKPAGWTSHDVVARCRKIFGQKRVGHSGTLDPDATGVLLIGLGRATRLLRFLTDLRKSYECDLVLGVATSTLDASGDVIGEWDMGAVTLDEVQAAAKSFVGDIEQVPPMVSAVKIGGHRLHDLARQGIEVERPPRPVTVYQLDVAAADAPGIFRLEVECSSGTYVRTLAADIGTALDGGAHLRNLRRTAIGSFTVADAVPLEDVTTDDVVAPAEALRDYDRVVVGAEDAVAICQGKPVHLDAEGAGPWAVLDQAGGLVAMFERTGDRIKSAVVLAAAG